MRTSARLVSVVTLLLTAGVLLAADSTVPTDHASIQAAINAATTVAGDTITVLPAHAGDPVNVHVTKAVTIAGQGIGVTILANPGIAFYPDVDGITFRDMTIVGGSQAFRFDTGGGTIDNTLIDRVEAIGLSSNTVEIHNLQTVTNLTFRNSRIDTCRTAVRVSSSGHLDGVVFEDNTVVDTTYGFYEAAGSSSLNNVTVERNTFQNGTYGLYLEEAQNMLVQNNTFLDNFRDIQILKWYNAALPVANFRVLNNTSAGATNAVFGLFNAHHTSGQTEFDNVLFRDNTAVTAAGLVRAIYAGAHSGGSSSGGTGWDTVEFLCNNFSGYPIPGPTLLVDFYDPVAVDGDTLGGALIDVNKNWWGTPVWGTVQSMMELPAITIFDPVLDAPNVGGCPQQPLLIELESFRAVRTPGGVEVTWKTIFEIDTVGFRLIRGQVGNGVQKSSITAVMPEMIPAAGTESYGAVYEVEDEIKGGAGTVFYLLEDIDTAGKVTRHGPVFVKQMRRGGEVRDRKR